MKVGKYAHVWLYTVDTLPTDTLLAFSLESYFTRFSKYFGARYILTVYRRCQKENEKEIKQETNLTYQ